MKPLLTSNPNKSNRQPDEILERERPESELKLVEIPGIFADETSLSVVGLVTSFVVVTFYDTLTERAMKILADRQRKNGRKREDIICMSANGKR